jgi:hypothetical protein
MTAWGSASSKILRHPVPRLNFEQPGLLLRHSGRDHHVHASLAFTVGAFWPCPVVKPSWSQTFGIADGLRFGFAALECDPRLSRPLSENQDWGRTYLAFSGPLVTRMHFATNAWLLMDSQHRTIVSYAVVTGTKEGQGHVPLACLLLPAILCPLSIGCRRKI